MESAEAEKEGDCVKGREKSRGDEEGGEWQPWAVALGGRVSPKMGLLVFYETCPFFFKCSLIFLCFYVLTWAQLHGKCMRSKRFLGMFYT